MTPITGLAEPNNSDILISNGENILTSIEQKLREAIDVVFFAQDSQANEKEKLRKYREFQVNKFGVVQFSDHVTGKTKDSRDIISRVQETYDELISLVK